MEGAESYVLRGGALNNSVKHVCAANRARSSPAGKYRGFNVVLAWLLNFPFSLLER